MKETQGSSHILLLIWLLAMDVLKDKNLFIRTLRRISWYIYLTPLKYLPFFKQWVPVVLELSTSRIHTLMMLAYLKHCISHEKLTNTTGHFHFQRFLKNKLERGTEQTVIC